MKKNLLIDYLRDKKKFYLLYSGGFDSSSILGCAIEADVNVTPVWINNGFNRAVEAQIRAQALNLGCNHLEVIHMEPGAEVLKNPVNRCYHCKGELIAPLLIRKDAPVFDGTNAADTTNYRPGFKALQEAGVKSPLLELGITAEESREIAISCGADPLLANMECCLATRFNYDVPITKEKVDTIRKLEQIIITQTGDYHTRCRLDDAEHLRIEAGVGNLLYHLGDAAFRFKIVETGEKAATFVTIDLEGARKNMFDQMRNL